MNRLKKTFLDKKFRYGAFSTLITVLVIACVIALNFVLSFFDLQFDLTHDKRYSISDETKKIISGLNENITIYALIKTGGEDFQYAAILDNYDKNPYITVEYIDPYLYPSFARELTADDLPIGSLVVVGEHKSRVIPADDLFTWETDMYTGARSVKSFDIEPRVTNAIRYVSGANTIIIYYVSNHNEIPIPESVEKQLIMANYEIRPLNLFNANEIPEDTGLLLLTTPGRDYSAEEAAKALKYLQSGGRALIMADTAVLPTPNFYSVMESYNVTVRDNLVLEGSLAHSIGDAPYYVLPDFLPHEITDNMPENTYALMIYASSVEPMEAVRSSVRIEPLLATSRRSYAKTGEINSVNKESGDIDGPFNVAVAITDSVYMPHTVITKLVITGSSSLVGETANIMTSGGNGDFIINAVNWLNDYDETIYIRPKLNIGPDTIFMTDRQARVISYAAVYVLPAGILIAGIVVKFRRRR